MIREKPLVVNKVTEKDNPTELTRPDIDEVVRTLETADAHRISDVIEGDLKFGTSPRRSAYFGMASSELIGSRGLENVEGFINVANYPSQANIPDSEWGSIGNVRFLLSSIGSKIENASLLGRDVYNIFITGMEAYARVYQDNYTSQIIYRDPMYSGPLAQVYSLGYKMANANRILNDSWIIAHRCTLA